MRKPLNDNVLIKPGEEKKGPWETSTKVYSERGELLAVADGVQTMVKIGSMVDFNGFAAAFFEEDGVEYCTVPYKHLRTVDI